jgi:lysophospholipase L1-like esterase
VNFTALPTRLVRIWRSRPGSPRTRRGSPGGQAHQQLDPAAGQARPEQLDHVVDQARQVEGDPLEHEPAGVEPGEVEHVVEHGQQRLGRTVRGADALRLLGIEPAAEQQLGHPEDAVHRGADLNAGWGGDTAEGGLRRLQRDVLALKPTLVTVCYGMNDGGYRAPDPGVRAWYRDNLARLIAALMTAGCRVAVLTPGCVDGDRQPGLAACGYNRTLRGLADEALAVAAAAQVPAFDLLATMLAAQTAAKAADPAFTCIPDAVHPDPAGHVVMAYALLRALGVPPRRDLIEADAASGAVAVAGDGVARAAWRGRKPGAGLRIDLVRLPCWIEPAAQPGLALVPFQTECNAITLRVRDLPAGGYALRLGGRRLPVMDAATLAAGIDLAGSCPPERPARVHAFIREQCQVYFRGWRNLALDQTGGTTAAYDPAVHRAAVAASLAYERGRQRLVGRRPLRLEPVLHRVEAGGGDVLGDGDFLAWFRLRGPFPKPFRTDHLGGEAAFSAAPACGDGWTAVDLGPVAAANCLGERWPGVNDSTAYALAVLDSPIDQDATLLLGSDDGIAAWLNGALVHDNLDAGRGVTVDADRAAVRLRTGRNHLLLKLSQYGGSWGFCARFSGLERPLLGQR